MTQDDKVSKKWEFLGALYQHGSKPDALSQSLPKIDLNQIKTMLHGYRERAKRKIAESRTLNKSDDAAIDLWYDYVENCHTIEGTVNEKKSVLFRKRKIVDATPPSNDYSFLLSKSMMYAAYFEEHFQSNNPNEPNYSEIYRYLSQILAGEEPTQLRPGNAAKILEMVGRMKNIISDKESTQRYLTYMKENHEISYLKKSSNTLQIAKDKRETLPVKVHEEAEKHKEFLSECTATDAQLENISQSDRRFFYKRENSVLKLSLKQRSLASAISYIPGMNPLEVVPQSLVKPSNSIIAAKKRTKRARVEEPKT